MALTINTNMSSIVAQKNLNNATKTLNSAIERMTTGYKINHAGDNAAGYSIAKNWETQLSSLDVAADNAATGADMLSTLEDNYSLVSSHLQRIRDLTEQAANGTYGVDSLTAIKSEIMSRMDEINRIASNCEFNGIKLMTDSISGLNIQVGLGSDDNSKIALDGSLFDDGTLEGLAASMTGSVEGKTLVQMMQSSVYKTTAGDLNGKIDITKLADAETDTDSTGLINREAFACACAGIKAKMTLSTNKVTGISYEAQDASGIQPSVMLDFLDKAIKSVSNKTTTLGAAQNRIDSAIESIAVQSENITSSLSTLRDADISKESSKYIQSQILQQAAATLLSTANQTPSIALNLI